MTTFLTMNPLHQNGDFSVGPDDRIILFDRLRYKQRLTATGHGSDSFDMAGGQSRKLIWPTIDALKINVPNLR